MCVFANALQGVHRPPPLKESVQGGMGRREDGEIVILCLRIPIFSFSFSEPLPCNFH